MQSIQKVTIGISRLILEGLEDEVTFRWGGGDRGHQFIIHIRLFYVDHFI